MYYNNNPYAAYGYQPSQQNYNSVSYQTPQQPVYTPLTFVNGIDEVSRYIVNANTTIYLRDNKSNKLYVKSCDSTGQYSLKTYELVEVDENGSISNETLESSIFATKEDLQALEAKFKGLLSKVKKGEVSNEQ